MKLVVFILGLVLLGVLNSFVPHLVLGRTASIAWSFLSGAAYGFFGIQWVMREEIGK
jgi:hypothetical protein